jgi:hypothetical protein
MKRFCLVVAFLLSSSLGAWAQGYQLHGVYIYSFTKYVQWPDEANQGDFEIHVLGDSPILAELNEVSKKKKVGERPIKVTRIASVSDIKKCNILFVPVDKSGQLADVLSKVGTNATLVVTEQNGLGAKGSCINFIDRDGKLAFEINQAALTKQRLKASNELMRFGIVI